MVEQERVLGWDLKVDRALTEAVYRELPLHSTACSCECCLNFERACDVMPARWWAIFRRLGIDPRKASGEVYQFGQNEDGSQFYGGVFHVCGEIVDEPGAGEPADDPVVVAVTRNVVLVDERFPHPRFQVEIATSMPWVLPTPPPA